MSSARLTIRFSSDAIDRIIATLDQSHSPGAAVGIAIGGIPVYRKGFGLASVDLPVLLSPTIRLRIGSTSKQFACFAYLLLCEQGRAGLDDRLEKFLPELNPVTRRVTMRQLMSCTSGLRDVYDIFSQFNDHYVDPCGAAQSTTSEQILRMYCEIDDVNAMPGTTWSYNNGGWLLLTAAIERITGQPLEDVMQKMLFEPLGMYDTLMLRSDSSYLPNRASQHVSTPGGGYERLYWGLDNFVGAGAIVSTADDMLRWLAHMDAPVIGTADTLAQLKEPQRLTNGTLTGYALGLVLDRYRGVERLHHAGNCLGGNAQMVKIPAAGLDVTVIVNRQDVFSWELADRIVDACLPGLDPVREETSDLPSVVGVFRSPETGRVIHLYTGSSRSGEHQQFASFGGSDLLVRDGGAGRLAIQHVDSDSKQILILQGEPAWPAAVRFSDYGTVDTLVRVPPVDGPLLNRIRGDYRSRISGTSARISETAIGPTLSTTGAFGSAKFRLECLAKDIWRATPMLATRVKFLGGLLSFDEDAEAFSFSTLQTRSLRFQRCK